MSEDCQHDKSYRYAHYEQRKLGRVTVQFCIACAYEQITAQLKPSDAQDLVARRAGSES